MESDLLAKTSHTQSHYILNSEAMLTSFARKVTRLDRSKEVGTWPLLMTVTINMIRIHDFNNISVLRPFMSTHYFIYPDPYRRFSSPAAWWTCVAPPIDVHMLRKEAAGKQYYK